jgi:hypothetical protein
MVGEEGEGFSIAPLAAPIFCLRLRLTLLAAWVVLALRNQTAKPPALLERLTAVQH